MTTKLKLKNKSDVILSKYIEVNNRKYYADGKNVVFEPTKKELSIALWLANKLDETIIILPRIKQPEGVKTSDYIICNESWDLKEIISNRKDAVYNRIRNKKEQSTNFIIDISKSKLTIKAVVKQVNSIYQHKNYKWLNKIIIKKNDEIIFINRK